MEHAWNRTGSSLDQEDDAYRACGVRANGSAVFWAEPAELLQPWAHNPQFVEIVVTYSLALLVGLVGNSAVVLVMAGGRSKSAAPRSATNLFLASLAAADLLLLLVHAPLETLQYFVMQWDEAGCVCRLAKYAEFLSAVASVLNLTAVTLERFVVIVFPMRSRSLCTLSNCRRGIVLVWLVALLLAVPVIFTKVTYAMCYYNGSSSVTLFYCNEVRNGLAFAIYQLIIVFAAPGALMLVCYTCVIRELWRSTRSMRILTNNMRATGGVGWRAGRGGAMSRGVELSDLPPGGSPDPPESLELTGPQRHGRLGTRATTRVKGHDARRARKQVIKMLILVVILFLVCWGSRIIMELLLKVGLSSYDPAIYRLRVALFVLPVVHSCINPFVYSFMSKNFRRALQRQLGPRCCCCGRSRRGVRRGRTDTLCCNPSRAPLACSGVGGPGGLGGRGMGGTRRLRPPPSSFSSTYNCGTTELHITKHTELHELNELNELREETLSPQI